MSTVLLRLGGPAQSWGASRASDLVVPTETIPTRAGLLGMLAAGLGLPRGQKYPEWLTAARITARPDRTGRVFSDLQTVNPVPERLGHHFWRSEFVAGRTKKVSDPAARVKRHFITKGSGAVWDMTGMFTREFLADAEYIVAITVDEHHTPDLLAAVRTPKFCTYLGRKAFAPTFPFFLGVSDTTDHEALLTAVPAVIAPGAADTAHRFIYSVAGDRNLNRTQVTVPTVTTRKEQLTWLTHSLSR